MNSTNGGNPKDYSPLVDERLRAAETLRAANAAFQADHEKRIAAWDARLVTSKRYHRYAVIMLCICIVLATYSTWNMWREWHYYHHILPCR